MKTDLKAIFSRIDHRRLSGVRSVLGISLEGGSAFVVELRRKGNPLDSISGKIEAVRSFRCTLKGQSPEESGEALKSALAASGVQTTYAVISPREARYISAVIPTEVENATEWVEENAANLLHLPIPPSELEFNIENVRTESAGQRVLLTFVRKREIDNTAKLAALAGLTLLSIQPGLPGLIPVCALSYPEKLPHKYRITHLSQEILSTLSCEDGRVCDIKVDHIAPDLSLPDVLERARGGQNGTDMKVFASGAFQRSHADQALIRPFGLTSDFALASGLALSGILHNLSSANFLPRLEREGLALNLAKSLLKRTALVSGFALLTVLALPLALSGYVSIKSDQIDEAVSSNRDRVTEIDSLEREASILRESARRFASPESRSSSSFALHEIAKQTPKGIRLLSIVLQADGPSFVIKGEAESQKAISEYMRSLKGSLLCRELSLRKLDVGRTTNGEVRSKRGQVYFELGAQLAPGKSM